MKVTFTEKEFSELRKFQNAFNKKMGEQAYVGTDHCCLLVEYSPQLKAMLRPYPPEKHYEFELRNLECEDCKKMQPFLCAKEDVKYLCHDCAHKRELKAAEERTRQAKKK